jgi:uncharacterized protein (DUF302 family)
MVNPAIMMALLAKKLRLPVSKSSSPLGPVFAKHPGRGPTEHAVFIHCAGVKPCGDVLHPTKQTTSKPKPPNKGESAVSEPSLGITTVLKLDYDQAVQQTVAALKEQGFGVLTEIDVKATMKAKLDVDFQRYVILGACNPPLAYQALSTDKSVGLMLPCNVVVYDNGDGSSTVSALNPMAAMGVVGNPGLDAMATAATAKLTAAIERLNTLP